MASRKTRGFSPLIRAVVRGCALVAMACLPTTLSAAVPWHADLTQAKTASQISRRPVFVLFVATWYEPSINHDKTFLASEEAVALLTACFEPVRIDVDADPETMKRLQVTLHLPCACVIDAEEHVLARFDCPPSSAAFVAAAGRAAQEAAVACAGPLPKAAAPAPPSPATTATSPNDPATAPADPTATAPALTTTPPQWPAEDAAAPLGSSAGPTATAPVTTDPTASIEPAPPSESPPSPPPSGLAAALPSWLNPKPNAPAPSAPAPSPEPPAEKKPGGFWATVQKPFTGLVGKTTKPPAEAAPPAELPSTGVPGSEPGGSMPVGLEGYCAVSLVDRRTWVEGRAKWGVRHRGRTYLFAGPEEQKAFLANPDRYAPGLSGDDPVLAIDLGRKVSGQRQYGVSYRSKIYLFSSPDTKAAFEADPQKYAQRVQLAEQPAATTVR